MSTTAAARSTQWERDPDNWYVEPSWVSERLFEVERFEGRTVDPCAGGGNIVRAGRAAGIRIDGYDLRDRGAEFVTRGVDFLGGVPIPGDWPADNIVSNPPYGRGVMPGDRRLEERFLVLALARTRRKVAVFLPASWPNGDARGRWLETLPWYRTYLLSPRPSCPPGAYLAAGGKRGGGTTDYAWFVFLHGFSGSPTTHFLRRDP